MLQIHRLLLAPSRARLLAGLLTLMLATLMLASPVLAQGDFGVPTEGVHVYDHTGLLTPDQIADLEERAAKVEAAGAPTVVYVAPKDADTDTTIQDARDLMETWDIQSATDARDGVVIYLNLKPDDLHHGSAAIIAGKTHFDGGALPQKVLNRIYDDEMAPHFKEGDIAGGIAAGLDATAAALIAGPPPPTAFESFAERVASEPLSLLNSVALAIAAGLGFLGLRGWQSRPQAPGQQVPTTIPPDQRSPAEVGALVNGKITDAVVEGTLLDFARRGMLAIEPQGRKDIQIHLLGPKDLRGKYEETVWDMLTVRANPINDTLDRRALGKFRENVSVATGALRKELEAAGLYDPNASGRRVPLYLASAVGFILTMGVFILGAAAEQPWAFLGAGLLAIATLFLFITALSLPDTTAMGEAAAAPWRGYRDGIKAARRDQAAVLDLDEVMPYAAAMGITGDLDKRLKSASETGYEPLWLGRLPGERTAVWYGGFYPYWITFHTAVSPPSSSGGTTGGGASAGSGAAGGSF